MKKKVLVFIDWYLPGYKAGGPIQSVSNMVSHLKDEFEFSIITRDTDYCETISYPNVVSDKWNLLEDGSRVFYFSKENLTRYSIAELLQKEEYDFVYLNGIFSKFFTLWPLFLMRKRKDKTVIIAVRGMFADSALNVKKVKKKMFLFIIKASRIFYNVIFHVTNENERKEVERVLGNRMHIMMAGNLAGKSSSSINKVRSKSSGEVRFINIARIAPEKNLLFALEILKGVKGKVFFDFYGPLYNETYWDKCREAIKQLPSNIKAEYKGSIDPSKVSDLLTNYHFMFMPTRGENFGHIILQSFTAGLPVIISDKTPWTDLKEMKAGWAIPLEGSEIFVKVIEHCVEMDEHLFAKISNSAFVYGAKYVSDEKTLLQNRKLFSLIPLKNA
ncbi:glycosyltransferase family 4 protein [Patescibacteria group bacterium]|nr:glycosyltransferase family 4 protein [Patescibacteria group bacterium]